MTSQAKESLHLDILQMDFSGRSKTGMFLKSIQGCIYASLSGSL